MRDTVRPGQVWHCNAISDPSYGSIVMVIELSERFIRHDCFANKQVIERWRVVGLAHGPHTTEWIKRGVRVKSVYVCELVDWTLVSDA